MSKTDFAAKMNYSKGYVSQVLNGNVDHRLSKIIELSLAIGKVPEIKFKDISEVILEDELYMTDENLDEITGISQTNTFTTTEEKENTSIHDDAKPYLRLYEVNNSTTNSTNFDIKEKQDRNKKVANG